MDDAGIPALVDAIRDLHHCEATWVESAPVVERFQGKTVWEGEVQVFSVTGHPTSDRCYAWSYATSGPKRRFVAVLHLPPVTGPRDAVRAFIASSPG